MGSTLKYSSGKITIEKRSTAESTLFSLSISCCGLLEELRKYCDEIPKLVEIRDKLLLAEKTKAEFLFQGELLLFIGKIYVPMQSSVVDKILKEFRNSHCDHIQVVQPTMFDKHFLFHLGKKKSSSPQINYQLSKRKALLNSKHPSSPQKVKL